MNSKNELEKVIKNKVKSNQINDAINILENEIKQEFIDRLKEFDSDIKYVDIIQLKDLVEKNLSKTEQVVFKKFFLVLNTETNQLYRLERLVDIYNVLKRGGK